VGVSGGKVEGGGSKACLRREFAEELGSSGGRAGSPSDGPLLSDGVASALCSFASCAMRDAGEIATSEPDRVGPAEELAGYDFLEAEPRGRGPLIRARSARWRALALPGRASTAKDSGRFRRASSLVPEAPAATFPGGARGIRTGFLRR